MSDQSQTIGAEMRRMNAELARAEKSRYESH